MQIRKMIAAAVLPAALLCGCGGSQSAQTALSVISEGYIRQPEGAETVTLYSRPDTGSEAVAELHADAEIQIYQLRNGWYYISCGEKRGYLQGDAVRFTLPEPAAETAPAPAEADGSSGTDALPAETEHSDAPQQTEQTPGELFISESEILQAVGREYQGYVNCSGFPEGLHALNCEAEVVTETVGGLETQKGIKVHYTPDGGPFHIDGWLHLYYWEWKDETGGEIVVRDTGELVSVYINSHEADGMVTVDIITI